MIIWFQRKAGNSLVEGKVKASGTVSFKEINGEYSYIEKIKEVYTMHTRTVCETVGSGENQHEVCHLETYWTWDYAGSEPKYAKEISIYDHKLDTRYALKEIGSSRLNLSKNINDQYKQKRDGNCIYESGYVRYYYKYILDYSKVLSILILQRRINHSKIILLKEQQ